jgi:hypothetical protein
MGFGHFISLKSGDGYNTFIGGANIFNASNNTSNLAIIYGAVTAPSNTINSIVVARLHNQLGSGVSGLLVGMIPASGSIMGAASTGLTYPNPSDSGLYIGVAFLVDAVGSLRGRMPGFYYPLHSLPFQNYDEITNITGLSGVTLISEDIVSNNIIGQRLIDKWGPWV